MRIFELFNRKVLEMFVNKHSETIENVKSSLLFKKNTNIMGEKSRIVWIKNAKFSEYFFNKHEHTGKF